MNAGISIPNSKPETKDKQENKNNIPLKGDESGDTQVKINNSDEDLEEPYTDERSVTIMIKPSNLSYYRKANDKVMPKKVNYIGSSYNSSLILSSNKTEIETYFPALLGIAPNNESFITRVKQYLNNIQIPVDELGKTFNTSFVYDHKKDYYEFAKKEANIEQEYQAVDRGNIKKLKEALQTKILALNTLESQKCKFGHPVKLEDYIMYRHCLLYKDIAKDLSLMNDDNTIRFYFKDDKKEADRAKKLRLEIVKAKNNYIACYGNDSLFEAVYIQYCALYNKPILSSLSKDRIDKELELDKFSTDEPVKFNKICSNKDCEMIGRIEKLIARGELTRIENTQNIITSDGQFVGANMTEALAWFKNPEHYNIVSSLINKLSTI